MRQILTEIIAALFILLFVYTAVSKLTALATFKAVLRKSPLVGNLNTVVAWAVPITELAISFLLFLPRFRTTGLLLSSLLMSVFTLYIGYMLVFAPGLPCSCGGVIKELGWRAHLLFNAVWTVLGFLGWRMAKLNERFIAINRSSRKPV